MKAAAGPRAVQVRRLRVRDAPFLVALGDSLFDRPPATAALRSYLADPRNLFLMATIGGVGAGFLRGTMLRQLHTRRPQMFLYEIGVVRQFRRQGVGRALLHWLLRYCREHRYDEVFVLTQPSNRAAVRLYRNTGAVTETPGDRMFVYPLGRSRPRSG